MTDVHAHHLDGTARRKAELVQQVNHARHGARPLGWDPATPADLAQGYAVALAVRGTRIAAGEVPVGYKVGFTNRTIWPRYAVFAPIWGTVWQDGLVQAEVGPAPVAVSLGGLCEPRIEPEIVFGFREPPPPGCTLAQLAGAIGWVAHGFEIVHTHFAGWKFTAAQGVADGGLHGRLVVGPRCALAQGADPSVLSEGLGSLRLQLFGDGVLKDEGLGANVLDGPLQALLHFVREIRATPDAPALQAGDIVTTGTLTDAWPVAAGQVWHTGVTMPPRADMPALPGLALRFTD